MAINAEKVMAVVRASSAATSSKEMLKKISTDARKDCERFMGTKVYLQTWVRVKEHWRDSDYLISNFGYSRES